jgi:hypothetical protein
MDRPSRRQAACLLAKVHRLILEWSTFGKVEARKLARIDTGEGRRAQHRGWLRLGIFRTVRGLLVARVTNGSSRALQIARFSGKDKSNAARRLAVSACAIEVSVSKSRRASSSFNFAEQSLELYSSSDSAGGCFLIFEFNTAISRALSL